VIKIENLKKNYKTGFFRKNHEALKGMSLEVKQGDIYGFVGPNGAGKSTTIKILLGLLHYQKGSVLLFGSEIPSRKSRMRMGYLPEHPYYYDHLSGWDLLQYFGRLQGLSGADLKERVNRSLATVNADKPWIYQPIRRYSKGMTQRVGLAQAILHEPELLILDEPMSGLDPVGRRDVRQAILDLNRNGTTIFYSSHVLGDVQLISNRIGMVIDGEMRMEGNLSELLKDAESKYIVELAIKADCPIESVLQIEKTIICDSYEIQKKVLQWAIQQEININKLEEKHVNLEELLSKEIARNV
jgi:ABC-2 type transport system ATP-binding protein